MRRRLAIRTILLAGASACLRRLPGRVDDQPPQPDFVIRSDVRLVLLDVAVKDHHGGFVEGLTQNNFQVLENGEVQSITAFANEDVPVTIGILVDESRSILPKRDGVLSAATAFIRTSNPRDEIFVLNFNDNVKRGLPPSMLFSDDIDQLRAALYRGMPRGRTALNDAIVDGLDQVARGTRGKKALVVISDGGDNASRHTRGEMYAMVERSMATIYTIGLLDPSDPDWNPGLLRRLANVSGGEAIFLEDTAGMKAVCEHIAKEIRTRYTIGYKPPFGKRDSLRHVQVLVSAPGRSGLTALTRSTYFYEGLTSAEQK